MSWYIIDGLWPIFNFNKNHHPWITFSHSIFQPNVIRCKSKSLTWTHMKSNMARHDIWYDMTCHEITLNFIYCIWHDITYEKTWHKTWDIIYHLTCYVAWHDTAYDMTWHDLGHDMTTWHDNMTWHDMTWHDTWHKTWYTIRHNMPFSMTWHNIWYEMTWHDIWYDMTWYMLWHYMTWHDMTWHMKYERAWHMTWHDISHEI